MIPDRVVERFVACVDQDQDPDECWIWPKSIASHGYGQVGWMEDGVRFNTTAHRVAYIAKHGPFDPDLTVDHLCHVRQCVNWNHLRLLPNVENATDNGQGQKTHCPHGHEYNEANTYITASGHRQCRPCRKRWR